MGLAKNKREASSLMVLTGTLWITHSLVSSRLHSYFLQQVVGFVQQRGASCHHFRKVKVTVRSRRPTCICNRCHLSMRECSQFGCLVRLLPTFLGGNQGASFVTLNRIVENTP